MQCHRKCDNMLCSRDPQNLKFQTITFWRIHCYLSARYNILLELLN